MTTTSSGFEKQVLHVDDDESFLKIANHRLIKEGYQVTSMVRPEHALKHLLNTNCRVCILDIDMPRVTGLELLQEIKAYDGGIQVIMMTGLVSQMTVLESLRGGAEACFFKPMPDFTPLLEALDATFVKAERWWRCLHELKNRRASELSVAQATQ
ncbi:Transcriptional regulatory protein ZraR [Bremerella volcania]|uniref:Transcriptional regulatory protein ZraR n=1 Tax=Bremerella volcania TaxID=2527984 RepID=A0A518C5J2_9BACT|nr:response regulator [Bremerella volcania]QDU74496.1 Transcriptional regulatory protein ZraR [Bremerella volcania]